jgi:hypothetical protein
MCVWMSLTRLFSPLPQALVGFFRRNSDGSLPCLLSHGCRQHDAVLRSQNPSLARDDEFGFSSPHGGGPAPEDEEETYEAITATQKQINDFSQIRRNSAEQGSIVRSKNSDKKKGRYENQDVVDSLMHRF